LIVDSSALIAVVRLEPEEEVLLSAMVASSACRISAATWLEACIVVGQMRPATIRARFETLLAKLNLDIVPVSVEQAAVARTAYLRFGRGNHPARLNYGDCFAYALAKVTGEPLLFKGNDFSQTDITPALRA
jgi:ribonuclease VapC